VEAALASHLSPDGADRLEAALARRLDRMSRQIERLERHVDISNEALAVFVRFLIEFKLTTLAGFVLVPFGLFGRTAFLAERVLGNVVSSGVKILVLAVIVGIGSTIF